MNRLLVSTLIFIGVVVRSSQADVIESTDAGLLVKNEAVIAAPGGRVFDTLTERIGAESLHAPVWYDRCFAKD